MVSAEMSKPNRVIRDQAFAKRLEQAIYEHPHAPDAHGRQKWLRERLEQKFGTKLSPEALRKWFAGEAKPRDQVLKQIAQILEVDEAWLSLGLTPDASPMEKRQQKATAEGAVNLVAGLIQMAGGTIAFPESPLEPDLFAIIKGRRHAVEVKAAQPKADKLSVVISPAHKNYVVLTVVPDAANIKVLRMPSFVVEKHGRKRGGYIELTFDRRGDAFYVDETPLPVVKSFDDLEGQAPTTGSAPARRKLNLTKRALDLG